ncbi:ATP synthase mitochondrial F1 complex assembly factor 2 [Xylona heveae TC161]|uniref:ATP synthase mitochondrial F1 complex assembly factor 2 n=1 Tax=Xylona heveae (strain CBS 132557 / TC161) TaxID=1328760 RepID=A0A165HZA5_XYLHT|nr:ATP synthase mitochondrial F1 complex assembly factor 2 [Xylona heveae TC161]KZF24130.1 ATP synthase mitochondrial F1 complex assembly factor 2 [Xylona heveae TC161]
MKPSSMLTASSLRCLTYRIAPRPRGFPRTQCIHTSSSKPATPLPITAHGPPPKAPSPTPYNGTERLARRQQQAAILEQSQNLRATQSKPSSALRKRFWKHVSVRETEEGLQVLLDTRPVRTPSKSILTLPHSKSQLASAIALEWDLLISAQQALKHHFIPLTSLTARANDIRHDDTQGDSKIRQDIVTMVMKYLDTDTLLCWAPESTHAQEPGAESLRDIQARVAKPIIAFLTSRVWPGVEIKPILDSESILPTPQPQATQDVIRGWITGLSAFDLAGLERGVLASKSLLVAVRLLVEWSEGFRQLPKTQDQRFGIEEAAEASSLEVTWQTNMWGEVEDTHDVDKEDLRRQLGSVVLLVSGEEK